MALQYHKHAMLVMNMHILVCVKSEKYFLHVHIPAPMFVAEAGYF